MQSTSMLNPKRRNNPAEVTRGVLGVTSGQKRPHMANFFFDFLKTNYLLAPQGPLGDWSSELSFGRTRPQRPRRTLPSRDKYITTRDKYITTHIQVPRRLHFQKVIKRYFYNHISDRQNRFSLVSKKKNKFSRQTQSYTSTHFASVTIFRER